MIHWILMNLFNLDSFRKRMMEDRKGIAVRGAWKFRDEKMAVKL